MRHYTFPLCGRDWPVRMPDRPEDLSDFMAWVGRQGTSPVAVDSEGKGLDILCGDPNYVRLVQFGNAEEAWVIPTELGEPFKAAARDALIQLPKLVAHNASFDLLAFTVHLGLDLDSMMRKTWDTQILAKLIDSRQPQEGGIGSGLKPLSSYYVDPNAADTQGDLTAVFRSLKLTKATGWAGIDLFQNEYVSYAGGDVILTSRLLPILRAQLRKLGVSDLLVNYEHDLARICVRMQQTGLILDVEYTTRLSERLEAEAQEFTAVAASFGVDKIGSPKQLADVFAADGEELTEVTDNGAIRVDKSVLARLADIDFQSGERLGLREPHPLAVAVMKAKRASKWRSAYAENFLARMDANGRIHPGIRTMAARTGRMSVTDPAVQTLPSGDWMIRRCFLADAGHVMISTDFQAVELRVLAAVANVRRMKEAIAAGEDLHSFTARLVYGEHFTKAHRKIAKGIGFSKVYGGGAATTARQTGAPVADVQHAMSQYDRAYPEVKRFAKRLEAEAFSNGMVVTSATGRRLPLDRDRVYAATNYVVQSTARDCLGQALIELDKSGLTPYLRLPIHDEIVASAPLVDALEIAKEVERCMTFNLFGVPIVAEAEIGGRSWGSLYGADF